MEFRVLIDVFASIRRGRFLAEGDKEGGVSISPLPATVPFYPLFYRSHARWPTHPMRDCQGAKNITLEKLSIFAEVEERRMEENKRGSWIGMGMGPAVLLDEEESLDRIDVSKA